MNRKLLLVTTVPETFISILDGQPRYLSEFFSVIIATSDDGRLLDIGRSQGVSVAEIPMVRGINPISDLKSIIRMIISLRRIRPDIIQSYTPKAGLVGMLSAWICGVPVRVHTFTGLIFPTQTGFKKKLLIWIDRLICKCATIVVPEGNGVKKDLIFYGITTKPLEVIGHGNIAGVDTEYFDPDALNVIESAEILQVRLGMDASSFVFCFVGRLNRDKGIRELFEAFVGLPENAHLLVVGNIDESAPITKDLQLAMEKHPRVHTLGFMDDIRPALSLSDALVLPSYREGFPNVVLQAGAMGLPVIATDINGCNEVIDPGYNGWLVPTRNSEALFRAMLTALQTKKEILMGMGNRGRKRVQQRFERTHHWDRMRKFYQSFK